MNSNLIALAIVAAGAIIGGVMYVKQPSATTTTTIVEPAKPTTQPAQPAKPVFTKEDYAKVLTVTSGDHVRGNKDAAVTLYTYSDFECPFCVRFHKTIAELEQTYGEKVNVVFRHYPLPFHDPLASEVAHGLECAFELGGQDMYNKYMNSYFEQTKANKNGIVKEDGSQLPVADFAASIGLDKTKFEACQADGKYADMIKKSIATGATIGVQGTPSNFLKNNKTGDVFPIAGAQPLSMFKADLDKMLQ